MNKEQFVKDWFADEFTSIQSSMFMDFSNVKWLNIIIYLDRLTGRYYEITYEDDLELSLSDRLISLDFSMEEVIAVPRNIEYVRISSFDSYGRIKY